MTVIGKAFNTIVFRGRKCDGCGDCMTACAKAKTGSTDRARSRLKIEPALDGKGFEMALCRQCGEPKCVMVCPSGALTKDAASGVIPWDADKCVNCLLCTAGCAFAGITFDSHAGHVAKCDMCEGDPACVRACPHGALEHNTLGAIYNRMGSREDLFAPGLSACQGCNSELLIRHTLRQVGSNVVVATPPGCIPGMGTVGYNGKTGTKVPVFHPLLTNTASMLTGLKRQYKRAGRDDVLALALAGDGGATDVGFASLSGAAERNEAMLFMCVDNEGYMNTGMQSSGSTTYGSWTSTTPVGESLQGKPTDSKNMPVVMMMHNSAYVATASLAFMDDYYRKLEKAIEVAKTGFAYLHVYAPCPSGWRFASAATIEVCRKSVETNFVTLWEYEPALGLRFTRSVDKPLPVNEYVRLSGKYKHIDDTQMARIQQIVNQRVALLQRFETPQSSN